jgi:hypothetical protein
LRKLLRQPLLAFTVRTIGLISALLTLNISCAQGKKVAVLNTDQPTIIMKQTEKGATVSEFLFELPAINEGRLQIQLRTPLDEVKISLIDPSDFVVVTPYDPKTIFQPREALHKPERGDQFFLPEQGDPQAGIWKLRLSHKLATGDELIFATVTLLERFQLNLMCNESKVSAGQIVILTLLATDYGQPVKNLAPKIQVFCNGKPVGTPLTISSSATTPCGIRLTNESDSYLITYAPTLPGSYQFKTKVAFPGQRAQIIKDASISLDVTPEQASLKKLSAVPILGSGGCIKIIDFLLDFCVKKPGMYSLTLYMEGRDGQILKLSSTQSTEAGTVSFRIPLSGIEAQHKLDVQLLTEINSIDLLLVDDLGFTLVGRYVSKNIIPTIPLDKVCAP